MAYTKTIWTDRNVERPNTYSEIINLDLTKTFTASPGTITAAGTTISADKMNNIETGIDDLYIAQIYGVKW